MVVRTSRPSRRHEPADSAPDPFELVAVQLKGLSNGIKSLIKTDHPVLNAAAKYFFELDGGKKIRPTMVSIPRPPRAPVRSSPSCFTSLYTYRVYLSRLPSRALVGRGTRSTGDTLAGCAR